MERMAVVIFLKRPIFVQATIISGVLKGFHISP